MCNSPAGPQTPHPSPGCCGGLGLGQQPQTTILAASGLRLALAEQLSGMGSSQEGMVVVVITTQAMLLSAWRSGRQHIAGDGAGQVRAGWFAFAYYCAGFLCWLRSTKHLSPCGFLFSPNRVNDCCMIVLMGGQLLICVRLNATSKQTANYQPLWAPPPPTRRYPSPLTQCSNQRLLSVSMPLTPLLAT